MKWDDQRLTDPETGAATNHRPQTFPTFQNDKLRLPEAPHFNHGHALILSHSSYTA